MKTLKTLILIVAVSLSIQVHAHTKLTDSSPKDGSAISSSPEELKLTFSGKVKLMKVDLRTKAGNKVKLAFMLSPVSSETFSIPLSHLTDGDYVVHWVAMGKDSHKMKGNFTFKIHDEHKDHVNHEH